MQFLCVNKNIMEQLPIYINIVFVLSTLLAMLLLYKATNYSKTVIIITLVWLILQTAIGLTGFYAFTKSVPPRFVLLLMPPMILVIMLFITPKGRAFTNGFDIKTLTLFHIVRIPVELTLYWLYQHKAIPQIMTFEGRNFDILCGLTAPLVYYFGYIKNILAKNIILLWNIICLFFLANIVVMAVLSAPFPFQKFGFDQPNIAIFYVPFIWLPGFIVPAALLAHLATIRQLVKQKRQYGEV
jgi:hypothetical protein